MVLSVVVSLLLLTSFAEEHPIVIKKRAGITRMIPFMLSKLNILPERDMIY